VLLELEAIRAESAASFVDASLFFSVIHFSFITNVDCLRFRSNSFNPGDWGLLFVYRVVIGRFV